MRLLFTALLFGAIFVTASAQEGVDSLIASKDNTLYEDAEGKISNGSGIHFFTGKTKNGDLRRAVFKFDLTSLPENIEIQSAILRLSVSKTNATTPMDHYLHAITTDWGEGASNAGDTHDGDGTSAMGNDATWLHTFFATDGDPTWNAPGGDFEATPADTLEIGNAAIYYMPLNEVTVELLQLWYENPDTNYGFILIGNEEVNTTSKSINSRESDNPINRPQLKINYELITGIGDISSVPGEFILQANYPNPFNPTTTIRYRLSQSGNMKLEIFNIIGQRVRILDSGMRVAGEHEVVWNGKNEYGQSVPSGTYFYRLKTDAKQQIRKMLLIK